MSQADTKAGLVQDLSELARRGSGDQVLNACATLLSLRPVVLAIQGGAVADVAVRTLLEMAASRASDSQRFVRAAAALTGIDPPDIGRGVRSDPGPGQRQQRAGAILGGLGERAVRDNQQRYFMEYAGVVLRFVRVASQDHRLMQTFLVQCGVVAADAARLSGVSALTTPPSRPDHQSLTDDGSLHARLARSIPLSGAVRQVLDAAYTSCEARSRAFYTSDLLLALLEIPNGRTAACFEVAETGLSQRVRERLSQDLNALSAGQADPFQPFEWTERPDVQLAQDLALADRSAVVTEVYLLLGVLGSEDSTRGRLAEFLGSDDYDRLYAIANARRLRPPDVLRTPGPG
jgi:hypothetical protein